jgi:hypothetical protein
LGYFRREPVNTTCNSVFLGIVPLNVASFRSRPVQIAQSTNSVLMVRPSRFYPNETAIDNALRCNADVGAAARSESTRRQELRDGGVTVHLFQDTAEPEKPDAVFPNN